MIKLFKASNYSYTPFSDYVDGDVKYLNDNNIQIVTDINQADIIISQNLKYLKKYFWRGIFGKHFLIWTLEPKFNTTFVKVKKIFFSRIKYHVMNVYTGDVFTSNLTFNVGFINKDLKELQSDFSINSKKVIALMSYYKGINNPVLLKNSFNLDLISLRSQIALEGNKQNVIDIFGKGWPEGVSKEDSREGDWFTRKAQLLEHYHFNLCFENTAYYNYMSEKIWDSIENYCLPIYYGGNTNVYDLFPKDSFIDYSDFESPTELFDYINTISNEIFIIRMNKCIKVYNSISSNYKEIMKTEREKMLQSIVNKAKYIIEN